MSEEIDSLHMPFIAWLRERDLLYVHADPTRKATIQKGHPDFTVLLPGNRAVLIEFKTKTGRLSTDQKKRIAELEKAEIKVHVFIDLASAKLTVLEALKGIFSAVPLPAPEPMLWQHMGYVWTPVHLAPDRKQTSGFRQLRKCGPGDAALPLLFGNV